MKTITCAFIFLFITYAVGQVVPEPRHEEWWQNLHQSFVTNTADNPDIPIIFFGDSITEGWTTTGLSVFNTYYAPLGTVNYGIGGDLTQHVVWRIQNGEVEGLNPRLIVLKIGTNNLAPHTNQAIVDGIAANVNSIRQLLPETRILVLGILPRTGAALFDRIAAINALASGVADGQYVFYLDMFNDFTSDTWGIVPDNLFVGGLHLTAAGYELWAQLMNPLFNQLLQ